MGANVEQGAIVGDECVLEENARISADVKVYPSRRRGRRAGEQVAHLGVARARVSSQVGVSAW